MQSLFKRRRRKPDHSFADAQQPWQACLAVCSKCARKVRAIDGDKTKLRAGLKTLVALRGLRKKLRPVDVTCLDVCPDNRIVVAHMTPQGVSLKIVGRDAKPDEVLREFGI